MRINYCFALFSLLLLVISTPAEARLKVVATVADLGAIASEVGGEDATVESLAKGSQDPHFLEAKPSYMVKLSRADLLLAIGMELEVGWLPSLQRGARNPKVLSGGSGYLEAGPSADPLEVATGKLTRADGDVHPQGNPHVTLDPVRAAKIGILIAEKMAELDPAHAVGFRKRAKALENRLVEKTALWKARIEKSGVKKVVSYHKTLSYFFDRFGIANPAILEPKPGVPPTSGHIIGVIKLMKEQNVSLVLVENFFDSSVTKKILGEVPGARSVAVPVAVGGASGVNSLDDLYEALVKAVEGN